MTVTQTDEGDEFVVSWHPPEYGLEFLRVYVVREYYYFALLRNEMSLIIENYFTLQIQT